MIARVMLASFILVFAESVAWAEGVELGPGPVPNELLRPQPSAVVSEAKEAQLEGRVQARWQALIKGDFATAYQFGTPAYRAIYTQSQFQSQFQLGKQITWLMAKIKSIHYDNPVVARVRVGVTYHYAEPSKKGETLDLVQEINEIWLYREGQWWCQQD